MSAVNAPSDEQLMMAFAAGDARAFETLYDRHALPVWRFVMRSVNDRALADDLVQDVWFSLARQAPAYTVRARWRTWLFTLAHHRLVDHWRTHKNHASLDAATEDGASLADTLAAATLKRSSDSGYVTQGKLGVHSEHMGFLLAEMQSLARAHPQAVW